VGRRAFQQSLSAAWMSTEQGNVGHMGRSLSRCWSSVDSDCRGKAVFTENPKTSNHAIEWLAGDPASAGRLD